jgi:hypothetical protein
MVSLSPDAFMMRNEFKVLWVYTHPYLAPVVNIHSRFWVANVEHVREAMRFVEDAIPFDDSIPVFVFGSLPNPTAGFVAVRDVLYLAVSAFKSTTNFWVSEF